MPERPAGTAARAQARAQARALVLRHGWNAASYQILNPGMRLWFSRGGDAVAGFAGFARAWVVAGAPVCAAARLADVARELHADAAAAGMRVLYFGAGERLEHIMSGLGGHHLLRLGAQPVWDAASWRAVVHRKASLRAQLHRARNKGVTVVERSGASLEHRLPALRMVLDSWLATRGLPALHFMTEPDLLADLRDRRVFTAERAGSTLAFLVATPVPARSGWLVEEWPRLPGAPNGTTHALIDAAMRAFADAGARYVTLGLAPLSDRAGPVGEREPRWLRLVLHWVRAHGRRFYNFRGLDAFKASLEPEYWEPIYAIAPGPRVTPGMLRAVAGAFGGGAPGRLVARALWMAARRELRERFLRASC